MGLPKETMLSILAQLPESHLVKALDAAGVNIDGAMSGDYTDGMDDMGAGGGEEGLQSWNARQVKVPQADRPQLFDRNAIVDEKPPQPTQRPYAQPEPPAPNIAPFAAAAGG